MGSSHWSSWYAQQLTRGSVSFASAGLPGAGAAGVIHAELTRLGLNRSAQDRAAAEAAEAQRVRQAALARYSSNAARQQFPSQPPMAANAIDELPTIVYSSESCATRECVICTNPFIKGAALISLPCSELHVFHRECLGTWLARQSSCPMCRQALQATRLERRSSDSAHSRRSSSLFDEDRESALEILQPRSHGRR